MDEFSICFTDPLMIDMVLFHEWLLGTSEQDAAKKLGGVCMYTVDDIPFTILVQEVREQYILFHSLDHFLHSPLLLNSPMLCSLSPKIKEELIESYYALDKVVMREFLGKKMSTKLRKDMDDVSEKTGISLRSCHRQFDNVKNILKHYEDVERGLTHVLTKEYMFSDSLVRIYYPLILVFIFRFETTKKRLLYLGFDDIITCTEYMLQRWTSIADSYLSAEKSIDLDEIDQNFLHELRDLRTISIEKEFQDMQKSLVMSRLEQFNSTLHFLKSVEMNFRMISRNMFSLGAGLTQSKDFRDFFNDCVEKLIEPIKQLDWSSRELDNFLTAMVNSWKDIKENEHTRRFDAVYIRYMEVMKKCMLQMYK